MKIIFDNGVDAQTLSFEVSRNLAKKVVDMIWEEITMKNVIKACAKKHTKGDDEE